MTESTHTPGPWRVGIYEAPVFNHNGDIVDKRAYITPDPTISSKTICFVGGISDENTDANARLVAAAPDLLEALKKLAREHQDLLQEHYGHYPMNCIDYAFETISKAEGRGSHEKV